MKKLIATIAVDVMGSDLGTKPLVLAVAKFLSLYSDVRVILVGDSKIIRESLPSNIKDIYERMEIVNTSQIIKMTDGILDVRRKPDSSMVVAIKLVFEKKANAVVSAGATAPFIAANHFILKEIENVSRPGFMAIMPTIIRDKKIAVIDVGANVENSSNDLENFAVMASIYMQNIWAYENPKVGLLNIGTESSKGKDLHRETFIKLQNNKLINFIGNIEPNNFMKGIVDIVVCDGYSGNIALKSVEGMAKNLLSVLKKEITKNVFRKLSAVLLKSVFKDVKTTFDYRNTGGAILIGVDGISFKAHGNSDTLTFLSTLKLAYKAIKQDILNVIKENINKNISKEETNEF